MSSERPFLAILRDERAIGDLRSRSIDAATTTTTTTTTAAAVASTGGPAIPDSLGRGSRSSRRKAVIAASTANANTTTTTTTTTTASTGAAAAASSAGAAGTAAETWSRLTDDERAHFKALMVEVYTCNEGRNLEKLLRDPLTARVINVECREKIDIPGKGKRKLQGYCLLHVAAHKSPSEIYHRLLRVEGIDQDKICNTNDERFNGKTAGDILLESSRRNTTTTTTTTTAAAVASTGGSAISAPLGRGSRSSRRKAVVATSAARTASGANTTTTTTTTTTASTGAAAAASSAGAAGTAAKTWSRLTDDERAHFKALMVAVYTCNEGRNLEKLLGDPLTARVINVECREKIDIPGKGKRKLQGYCLLHVAAHKSSDAIYHRLLRVEGIDQDKICNTNDERFKSKTAGDILLENLRSTTITTTSAAEVTGGVRAAAADASNKSKS